MIKLVRIDDRLVHGQVAMTWVPALGVDCLLVANDNVAKDEFLKMTMGLAKPANTKLLIKTVKDAVAFLNDEKNTALKILLLINNVKDAYTLAGEAAGIKTINFGGIRAKDGAKLISKAVAVTAGDVALIKEMAAKGIELEIRQVPTDSRQPVLSLV
jgi:mannose/fructose/N-acetylgalactosamine-specific phosphotransferase system component IIB